MSNGVDLLRMLMPAVSPVPTRSAPPTDSQLPIESRSFDSLLAEAHQTGSIAQPEAATEAVAPNETEQTNTDNRLSGLTGIGSIHNASLRMMMSGDGQK